MPPRQTGATKLAPTVTESPQLQLCLFALASEDLECKAGLLPKRVKLFCFKKKADYFSCCLITAALFLLAGLLINVQPAKAQACISWQTVLGEIPLDERATDIVYNQVDGSFWACGYQTGPYKQNASDSKNGWLLQLNKQGELVNDFVIKDSTNLVCSSIDLTSNGIYVGGYFQKNDSSIVLNKWLSFFGENKIQWINKAEEESKLKDLVSLTTGEVITAGYINADDSLQQQLFVEKLNQSGDLLWSKAYGGSNDEAANALVVVDDKIVVVGFTKSANGDIGNHLGGRDAWLLELSISDGRLLREKTFGGTSNDVGLDIVSLPGNELAILAESLSSNGDISNSYGNGDFWLFKINSNWNILWEKSYGGYDSDNPRSLAKLGNNNLVMAGTTVSTTGDIKVNNGFIDTWVASIQNEDGAIIWGKVVGGNDLDYTANILVYDERKIALAGNTDSFDIKCKKPGQPANQHTNQNVWLFAMDDQLLDISETSFLPLAEIQVTFDNNSIQVKNLNSKPGSLYIVDLTGKAFIKDKINAFGYKAYSRSNLAKGIYFVNFNSAKLSVTEKMLFH